MNPQLQRLLENRNAFWALALLLCSVGSYLAGGLTQKQALPSVVGRLDTLQAALVAQDEEFEEARMHAERRIAMLTSKVQEMKSALVRMESWQISLGEMSGDASFRQASSDMLQPSPGFGLADDAEGLDLIAELNFLAARVNHRFDELRDVADALAGEGVESMFAPVGWPLDSRRITSRRGFRKDPFSGRRQWHNGVDIDGDTGDPIYAVASGVVTWSGPRSSFGQMVEISHAGGYVTRYAHNSINLVAVGDYVQRGQEIAQVGRTGRVTGSSLHFEVLRNGVGTDPLPFLRAAPR